VNPFSTFRTQPTTRVQAGAAFGGPIKKDRTYYYFSYEVTRRHETGFSDIGAASNLSLLPAAEFRYLDHRGSAVPLPFGTIQVTPQQAAFLSSLTPSEVGAIGLTNIEQYTILAGASSGQALQGSLANRSGFRG